MYRVVVNVSARRARIIPEKSKPMLGERNLGLLSAADAIANQDNLKEAVLAVLLDRGIANAETFSVEFPDNLRNEHNSAVAQIVQDAVEETPTKKQRKPKEVVPPVEAETEQKQEAPKESEAGETEKDT